MGNKASALRQRGRKDEEDSDEEEKLMMNFRNSPTRTASSIKQTRSDSSSISPELCVIENGEDLLGSNNDDENLLKPDSTSEFAAALSAHFDASEREDETFKSDMALAFADYNQDFSLFGSSAFSLGTSKSALSLNDDHDNGSLSSGAANARDDLDEGVRSPDKQVRRQQGELEDKFGKKTTNGDNNNTEGNNNDDGNSIMQFGIPRDGESRSFVFFLCFVGAILIASFTYVYTTRLNDALHPLSSPSASASIAASSAMIGTTLQDLQDEIQQQLDNLFEIFQDESEDITALASASHVNWPFWTIQDWDRRASHILHIIAATTPRHHNKRDRVRSTNPPPPPQLSMIGWAPLVGSDQIASWERYSIYHHPSQLHQDNMLWDEIDAEFMEDTYLAPIWQTYPPHDSSTSTTTTTTPTSRYQDQLLNDTPFNYNLFSSFNHHSAAGSTNMNTGGSNGMILKLLQEWNSTYNTPYSSTLRSNKGHDGYGEHKTTSATPSPLLGVLSNWLPKDNVLLLNMNQSSSRAEGAERGPYSLLMQPVYDTNDVAGIRSVKAILFGIFNWESFLHSAMAEVLPPPQAKELTDSDTEEGGGVDIFLSNSCGDRQFQQQSSPHKEGGTPTLKEIEVRPSPSTSDDAPTIVVLNNNQQTDTTKSSLSSSQESSTEPSTCHYYVELRAGGGASPQGIVSTSSTNPDTDHDDDDDPTKLSPAGFTAIVASVLAFMMCIVASHINNLHDHYDKVQGLATNASGVLLSMFPPTVCARILEEAALRDEKEREEEKQRNKNKKRGGDTELDSLHDSLHSRGSKSSRRSRGKSPTGKRQSGNRSGGEDESEDESESSRVYDKMILESVKLQQTNPYKAKPIADLFPEATVLFSDIVGFTAWSSSRCPTHVFDLLETIYYTFDDIARRRKVFKVETIGDCYVAVTGIPIPRSDHAVVMARFARDCLHAMDIVTAKLEAILGPDTSDLSMRFGIHSGPVTAGVLRGERSRFQLFGDTVNVAARMESNSKPGRIHISQDTANCLAAHKKSNWFLHREDKVHAKGKGELQTYWIDPSAMDAHNQVAREANAGGAGLVHPTLQQASNILETRRTSRDLNADLIPERMQRLIDWQVAQLHQLLIKIIARRKQLKHAGHNPKNVGVIPQATVAQSEVTVFDEVKEVIEMPSIHPEGPPQLEAVKVNDNVLWQLNDYVTSVSTLYRTKNPFHNFEHASHVVQSVIKMLKRVVAGPQADADKVRESLSGSSALLALSDDDKSLSESSNHDENQDHSYGITSDPLTQFAVVFAALIHDVDHVGVSNAQLVKENNRLARIYKNQSVAEQNSLNLAWDLLMDPSFSDLRKCIYTTEEEYVRFRSMVINCVMATDIVDADLKNLRNARWEKAFSKQGGDITKEDKDRKTTIIVEHLIQASDIAHTMQHWQVYAKWNENQFQEMYIAHKNGRMEKNPLDFWYNGEIGFFDFYIIPLAKKLKECGVFGVSCDEYLNYALNNRAEWEEKGKQKVEQYRAWAEQSDKEEELKLHKKKARQQQKANNMPAAPKGGLSRTTSRDGTGKPPLRRSSTNERSMRGFLGLPKKKSSFRIGSSSHGASAAEGEVAAASDPRSTMLKRKTSFRLANAATEADATAALAASDFLKAMAARPTSSDYIRPPAKHQPPKNRRRGSWFF